MNTETRQLGTRIENGQEVRNMVDMVGEGMSDAGGTRFVEVDPMGSSGRPSAAMREKLRSEIQALEPGQDLLFVDSNNPNRRIVFRFGDDPSVVDTRLGPVIPRRPRTPR